MITQTDAERALDFLRDNASKMGTLEANLVAVEEFKRVIRADQMRLHPELPVAAQEREALASPEYREHIGALQEATRAAVELRWLLRAAEARLSAWQTQSRNERSGP